MTIIVKNKHTLQIDDFRFNCCIGKKGSSNHKREGDNKTPKGTYEIENLYFRKDREFKPLTSLKCINIEDNMGWCNDIRFPTKYNKPDVLSLFFALISQYIQPLSFAHPSPSS